MRVEARVNEVKAEQAEAFIKQKLGVEFWKLPWDRQKSVLYALQVGCRSCPLCQCKYKPVPSILNKDSFALFIGRAPNEGEAQLSQLFPKSTHQGGCLEAYLRRLTLTVGECSFVNLAQCWSPGGSTLGTEHVSTCSFFKHFELPMCMGLGCLTTKFVFLMGDMAIRWVFGWDAPGVYASLGKVYKASWMGKDRYFVPIPHPSYLILKPELRRSIGTVLAEVAKLINQER